MKSSFSDKVIAWGTALTLLGMIFGGIAWITTIANTTANTAKAQEQFHDEVGKKLDEMSVKLDDLNAKTARIEGRLYK